MNYVTGQDLALKKIQRRQNVILNKVLNCSCTCNASGKMSFTFTHMFCTCYIPGVSFNSTPFRHCILSNFLQDEEAVDSLQDELLELNFAEKNNDLYKFHQVFEICLLILLRKPLFWLAAFIDTSFFTVHKHVIY
jgi:hypothetical protein